MDLNIQNAFQEMVPQFLLPLVIDYSDAFHSNNLLRPLYQFMNTHKSISYPFKEYDAMRYGRIIDSNSLNIYHLKLSYRTNFWILGFAIQGALNP